MLDHLRQIAVFAKTVEHGSFRKAAEALNLSPSVVSHHISRLEQEIGVPLFYRSTRKLSLTSEGERLLTSARIMLGGVEDFFDSVSTHSEQLIGELSITLPALFERSRVVSVIGEFARIHSRVNLKLDFSDSRRDIVKEGVDLAIRMGSLRDSNLKVRKLDEVTRSVVASAAYYRSKPEPTTLQDVEKWDWIALSPVGLGRVYAVDRKTVKSFRPRFRIESTNAHAALHLVASGNGIAALPDFMTTAEVESKQLVRVLPEVPTAAVGVYVVWQSNLQRGALAERFVNYLFEKLKGRLIAD